MKADRYFYTFAGALFLVLTLIGFRHYIFGGRHADGSPIDPAILAIVMLHGSAIFAWFVLFFVQSLLISVQNRRLHMKLGWSVLVIGSAIAVTGPIVAIRSVQLAPPDLVLWSWPYSRFLLIMLTEIVLFTAFATIGVINRKRPRIHRPMMFAASLALLTGATARAEFFSLFFGENSAIRFFGPVVLIGALLVIIRLAMTRRLDRWLAGSYAACMIILIIAGRLAFTSAWSTWATALLKF